ncbi:hypothetical protein [Methylovulum psychrotolerans]|nr:hypothetical protein [Methylovulum psychrotolerans]
MTVSPLSWSAGILPAITVNLPEWKGKGLRYFKPAFLSESQQDFSNAIF